MLEYNIVGKSSPIHDGMAKATGSLVYAGDMQLKNMCHGKLVYSTVPHGRIIAIDCEKALKTPGVLKVLTCFNSPGVTYSRAKVLAAEECLCQEQLFSPIVRFVGDRVALVLAESKQIATAAAKLIKVEYQKLPGVFSCREAQKAEAPKLYAQGNVFGEAEVSHGDFAAVVKTNPNAILVESKLSLGRLHHGAMETHVAVADYQPGEGQLTVWTPCQGVFGVRSNLSDIFGLPYNKIRVIKTPMGGSFGCKQETIIEPLAAWGAMSVNRPCKLVLTREEVIASTILRGAIDFEVTTALKPDGKIIGFKADATIEAGAYLTNSLDYLYAMSGALGRIYDVPDVKFSGRAVCTNTPVSGSYRSWGSCEIAAALEHNLQIAADRLGLDPTELRLKNLHNPNGTNHLSGISIGNCQVRACLERGKTLFDWQAKLAFCQDYNCQNFRYQKGVGVAVGSHVNGFYPDKDEQGTVSIARNEDGTVNCNICLHDHGCGTITVMKKIVAEVLGLKEDQVYIGHADTATNFWDHGCYASRTTYVLGRAAENCARKLADDPKKTFAVEDYHAKSNPTSASAHFAEITLDKLTGLVKVDSYLAVHDIGKAVNPAMCRAQIGGAVQQGMGCALTESIKILPDGSLSCCNFNKYHLVNSPDMPSVQVEFLEPGGDEGPFGAKSIGESAIVAVAPTIANALNFCLDNQVASLPMTPDKVVKIIQAKGEGTTNDQA